MSESGSSSIKKAVIPAAGHGTRLRPLTYITSKEMLPLGMRPTVEYIMDELRDAGVSEIIFVVSPEKTQIRSYFGDSAYDDSVRLRYVVQDPQNGLADAILRAEKAVGSEPFIVALGDSINLSKRENSPMARLTGAFSANPAFAALTLERIPIELACRFGMVKPVGDGTGESFEIDAMVEKPKPEEAPSNLAISGRYIFSPEIFDFIRRTPKGFGGEFQITDSMKLALSEGKRIWCTPLLDDETRYDIGSFETYCEAFAAVCLLDPDLAPAISKAFNRQ